MPDIFISYTSRDNLRERGETFGFVDMLHRALQQRLFDLCGAEVRVVRDPKGDGFDVRPTPAVALALERAAVLVPVVSPNYLQSAWCNDEVRIFCEHAVRAGASRQGASRIVAALAAPVDRVTAYGAMPQLADCAAYPFYQPTEAGGAVTFREGRGEAAQREFLRAVNELAYGICEVLETNGVVRRTRREVMPPSGISIYLAQTGADIAEDRERLRAELEQFGHRVLPASPIPLSGGYAQTVRHSLARCRISIHPVGALYGVAPEGLDRSETVVQYELAGEEARAREDLARLPWMPVGIVPADARQRAFLTALQDDPALLVSSLEGLKYRIRDLVTQISAPARPPVAEREPSDALVVYFICDPVDEAASRPVEEALLEAGCAVLRPLREGDERQLREDHEEMLRSADAVLIYHGRTSEAWLRAKVLDLRKTFGNGRRRPFLARAVVLAEPVTDEKGGWHAEGIDVLVAFGTFHRAVLAPFLDALRAAPSGA